MPIPSLTPNPHPLGVEKIFTPSGIAFAPVIGNLPALSTEVPGQSDEATAMRLLPQKIWNAGFSDVGAGVIDPKFATPFISGGTSYSQSAGSLAIVAPAVAGAEFLARSLENFKGSMRARFTNILSQRIANNNFAFLLADLIIENAAYTIISSTQVNVAMPSHGFTAKNVGQFANLGAISGAAGLPGRYAIASIIDENTVRFTVGGWPATGSGTLTVFGRNYIRTLFNGTGATSTNVDAQRNGWASGDTAISISTTNAPGTMIQMEYTGRDVFFCYTVRASSTTPNVLLRASRVENIPEHDLDLYVFLWSFNGSAAPASPTTWTLGHASVENFTNLPVYVQGVRAQGSSPPLPVAINGTQPVSLSSLPALAAGTNDIGRVQPGIPATPYILNSAASTNGALILTGSSGITAFYATNTGASPAYVKLYNKATAPAVATDIPAMIIPVPAAVGGVPGIATFPCGFGYRFALGLGIAITGGAADTDTTAIAAGQVKVILSRNT